MAKIKQILNTLVRYTNGVVDVDARGNIFVVERLDIVSNKDGVYLVVGDESPLKNHQIVLSDYMGRVKLSDIVLGETIVSLMPDKHVKLLTLLESISDIGFSETSWKTFVKHL